MNDDALFAAGIVNLNFRVMMRECSAWERAIYWAAHAENTQGCTWFVEDDIGWTLAGDLLKLFDAYPCDGGDGSADLVAYRVADSEQELPGWAHWSGGGRILPRDRFPLAAGFMVLSGMSPAMLTAALAFGSAHGSLAYLELFFPTLARAEGLRIAWFGPEALPLLALRYRPVYTAEEIVAAVNATDARIFHPVSPHWW